MAKKPKKERKTVEELIGECFVYLGEHKLLMNFLRDIAPLFQLYCYEDEDDWVEKEVGGDQENVDNIRIARTIYLMSKIAHFQAGKLCSLNMQYPDLWKKIEKKVEDGRVHGPDFFADGQTGQIPEHQGQEDVLPDMGDMPDVLVS